MLNYSNLPSPSYVCDLARLETNLKLLAYVKKESGAKIILALKGFAMWSTFELVSHYLDGATASGLHEALLAHEKMQGELHTYSPAFKEDEIEEIASLSDHMVFNTPAQLKRFSSQAKKSNKRATHRS